VCGSAFPGHPHRNRDARSGAGDGLTGVPPPAAVPPAGVVLPDEEPAAGVVLPDEEPAAGVVLPDEEPAAGVVLPDEEPAAGVVLPDEEPPAGVVLPDEEPPPPEAPTCAVELLLPVGGLFFDEGPAGDVPCADVGRPAVGWPAWAAVAGAGPRLEPGPVPPAPAACACAAALEFAWPPGCEDDAAPGPVPGPVAGCAPALSATATIAATPHSATPTPATASRRGPGRVPPGRPAVAGAPPASAARPAPTAASAAVAALPAASAAVAALPAASAAVVGPLPGGAVRASRITSARSATCRADSGRPSGVLASIASTRPATARGTSPGSGGTGSCLCMIATASGWSATNGGRPARHS
jgi:hypothetical protein